jgi:hypothetical protein
VLALMNGDFEPMWAEFAFSDDDRRYDVDFNDPRALGALWVAPRRSGAAVDRSQIVAPTLILGSDDVPETAEIGAEAPAVEFHRLTGLDHLAAFSRLDLVMPIVIGFLAHLGLQKSNVSGREATRVNADRS